MFQNPVIQMEVARSREYVAPTETPVPMVQDDTAESVLARIVRRLREIANVTWERPMIPIST